MSRRIVSNADYGSTNGLMYAISLLITLVGVVGAAVVAYRFYGMGWGLAVISIGVIARIFHVLPKARNFPVHPVLVAVTGLVLFYLLLGAQALFFPTAGAFETVIYWLIFGGVAQAPLLTVVEYPKVVNFKVNSD